MRIRTAGLHILMRAHRRERRGRLHSESRRDLKYPAGESSLGQASSHHGRDLSSGAIAEIMKSLEVDPLSVLARWNLGYFYNNWGQPERAAEEFRKNLEMAPGPDGHQGLGMAYTLENRLDDAIAELQEAVKLSQDNTSCKASLGYAYAMAGKRIAALKVVDDLKQTSKRKYVSAYLIAMVYAGLRDKAAAFEWLEKALRQRDDQLPALKVDPFLAPLRPDARFADLLRRIGLA